MTTGTIDQTNAAADARTLQGVEVDLAPIAPGQIATIEWQGIPVFVRRRTPEEIQAARSVPLEQLRDPEADEQRVQKSEWLILVARCTHRGCLPSNELKGDYGGWLCPCHGSQFDTSGRARKGPAAKNLEVPPYRFLSDTKVLVGAAPTLAAKA